MTPHVMSCDHATEREFWESGHTLKVLAEGEYFTTEQEVCQFNILPISFHYFSLLQFEWPRTLKEMLAEGKWSCDILVESHDVT